MRIALTIGSLGAGGAERVLTHLANHWAANGHKVTIITLAATDSRPFFDMPPSVAVHNTGLVGESKNIMQKVWANIGRVMALRHEITAIRPHVVVSFIDSTNVLVLMATIGLAIPVIISERIDPRYSVAGAAWRLLRRLIYRRAAAVVVQTQDAARYFKGWHLRRCDVMPNPVFPASRTARYQTREGTKLIISAGRLARQKRFDLLIRAFARLAEEYPEWEVVIVGDGPEREALARLVDSLGLNGRVRLIGTVPDLNEWLSRAELFVLASDFEGFPNVLCEALAAGLPVVATDCPSGPAEIVEEGINGFLVPPDNAIALADRMSDLMRDCALRVRLGQSARSVTEKFSVSVIMGKWDHLLSTLAGSAKPV